jgi:hypothetical protein
LVPTPAAIAHPLVPAAELINSVLPPQLVILRQYFYFMTAPLLLCGFAKQPEINQLLINKNWQQLGRFPHCSGMKEV